MNYRIGRRQFLLSSVVTGASLILDSYGKGITSALANNQNGIKVGIVNPNYNQSINTTNAIAQGTALALDEINNAGGVLGKPVQVYPENASDDTIPTLLDGNEINTWFGDPNGLTIGDQGIFWSPLSPKNGEVSKNTFYMGATPNQLIEPAVNWLLDNQGSDIFLISVEDEFSQVANAVVKQQLKARGGRLVGEVYLPESSLSATEMKPVISQIKNELPQGGMIFNMLEDSGNAVLFQEMNKAKLTAQNYPVMSVRLAEPDVAAVGKASLEGHYVAQNYFSTLNTPDNQNWVTAFQNKSLQGGMPHEIAEVAYSMVYLWKQAVESAQSLEDVEAIREAAIGQTFNAPEGTITVASNHHIARTPIIARVRRDGTLETVAVGSKTPVKPISWGQYTMALTGGGSPSLQHWPKHPPKGKTKLTSRHLWRGLKTSQFA